MSLRQDKRVLSVLSTHRNEWIQHRAKERVHAFQVLPAAGSILITAFKAHLVCKHSTQTHSVLACLRDPYIMGVMAVTMADVVPCGW